MSELYFKKNKEVNELLSAALDLGEHLLISGGEIARVEDTIRRLCVAYGAESVDVFTITSSIVVTAVFPECGAITQTRRISGVKWNLTAMEALNALSRKACSSKMDVAEIHDELRKIENTPKYTGAKMACIWMFIASGFSVFFGGSFLDAAVSGVLGFFLYYVQQMFTSLEVNTYLSSVLCSMLGGVISNLVITQYLDINPSMINIGVIMLLIPGIPLTNSLRDVFSGDTMSGMMRCCEALVLAVVIAWGFAVTAAPGAMNIEVDYRVQTLAALVGTAGFCLMFNVRMKVLGWCTLSGGLAWILNVICINGADMGEFQSFFIASMGIAVYAHVAARLAECPVTIFTTAATIPLIPGGSLYYTMRYAVMGQWENFAMQGLSTLSYAAMIAIGILVVNTVVSAYMTFERKYMGD